MPVKVAIQGQAASFHDQAARKFFNQKIDVISCDTFTAVFDSLNRGGCQYALVAIENSLYGSINEVYDLLLKNNVSICGEVYLQIHQCLIGLPGAKLSEIKEVHSHPVALGQCEKFLDEQLPQTERFEHHDTAGSVADVKKWNDPARTAIASQAAAELHGLTVLAENIETHHNNYTRFVVLSTKRKNLPTNKTSLILMTDHKPGALYKALGAFAERNINLTKLQSRPIIGETWHYMFYLDLDCGDNEPKFIAAQAQLVDQKCELIVLGSYQKG